MDTRRSRRFALGVVLFGAAVVGLALVYDAFDAQPTHGKGLVLGMTVVAAGYSVLWAAAYLAIDWKRRRTPGSGFWEVTCRIVFAIMLLPVTALLLMLLMCAGEL